MPENFFKAVVDFGLQIHEHSLEVERKRGKAVLSVTIGGSTNEQVYGIMMRHIRELAPNYFKGPHYLVETEQQRNRLKLLITVSAHSPEHQDLQRAAEYLGKLKGK
ncbi:MAG: hypothetical protein V1658_01795 [Candidatus Micrarchaeota archaeon]